MLITNSYFVPGGFEKYSVTNTVEYLSTCSDTEYEEQKWKYLAPMNIRR